VNAKALDRLMAATHALGSSPISRRKESAEADGGYDSECSTTAVSHACRGNADSRPEDGYCHGRSIRSLNGSVAAVVTA
jgi:hypothetical protein